jgi:hypothetical protein
MLFTVPTFIFSLIKKVFGQNWFVRGRKLHMYVHKLKQHNTRDRNQSWLLPGKTNGRPIMNIFYQLCANCQDKINISKQVYFNIYTTTFCDDCFLQKVNKTD